MTATRRTQLLMDPEEFRRLRALARRNHTSMAELIRTAVRQVYLEPQPDKQAVVDAILELSVPLPSWKRLKKEIEDAHADVP